MSTERTESFAAIVVAAGQGSRAAGDQPKQYRRLRGRTMLEHATQPFLDEARIDSIVVVVAPDQAGLAENLLPPSMQARIRLVHGGPDRQSSVLAGLEMLEAEMPDYVLVHDGARPLLERADVARIIDALAPDHGVLLGQRVVETLKSVDGEDRVERTVPRDGLWRAQTPQAFPYASLLALHRTARDKGEQSFTDDASLAEAAGLPVRMIASSGLNPKLTFNEDFQMAERLIEPPLPDIRVGNGYDVHRFTAGDAVILCGVSIPFDRRLDGHSDADVGLHALTDALLATIGVGDIGTFFPPSEERWRGAPSHIFVEHAVKLVAEAGGTIGNCDITLIAEAPKIGAHRDAMVENMAAMLRIEPRRVSVKATTNERLGFLGRGEGIAAIATACVLFRETT